MIVGCTDSSGNNYRADANRDDGSCVYDVYGCAEGDALNFDSTATVSEGCRARIAGCTDSRELCLVKTLRLTCVVFGTVSGASLITLLMTLLMTLLVTSL